MKTKTGCVKRYSVRRLGCTSWKDTDSLTVALKQREIANRTVAPGHCIVDNKTGQFPFSGTGN
jgi:hypothetical protein